MIIRFLLLFLLLAGCSQSSDDTIYTIPYLELEVEKTPEPLPFETMHILWDNGIIQYAYLYEDDNIILYEIKDSNMRQVTVFYPLGEFSYLFSPLSIFKFEVTDDWLVLSVGELQGSGRYFYGKIFRIRRDRYKILSFYANNQDFWVIDDYIYHHDIDAQSQGDGWIRIPIDSMAREPLDKRIHNIYFYSDGYIYGTHKLDNGINLVRWQPDSDEIFTIFEGHVLPTCEYVTDIWFSHIEIYDKYIIFKAHIGGVILELNKIFYTAEYILDLDKNILTHLSEEIFCPFILDNM